jgi:hypothetical protein
LQKAAVSAHELFERSSAAHLFFPTSHFFRFGRFFNPKKRLGRGSEALQVSPEPHMGAFLEAPITTKDTEAKAGNGVVAAVSSMQGWRKEMEVCVFTSLTS